MVTKLNLIRCNQVIGYILAKNHMVTKLWNGYEYTDICYILAKNHMVTKPQIS